MRRITVTLSDEQYKELQSLAAGVREMTFKPEHWAAEAIEAALASRRLRRVRIAITEVEALGRNPQDLELYL